MRFSVRVVNCIPVPRGGPNLDRVYPALHAQTVDHICRPIPWPGSCIAPELVGFAAKDYDIVRSADLGQVVSLEHGLVHRVVRRCCALLCPQIHVDVGVLVDFINVYSYVVPSLLDLQVGGRLSVGDPSPVVVHLDLKEDISVGLDPDLQKHHRIAYCHLYLAHHYH